MHNIQNVAHVSISTHMHFRTEIFLHYQLPEGKGNSQQVLEEEVIVQEFLPSGVGRSSTSALQLFVDSSWPWRIPLEDASNVSHS